MKIKAGQDISDHVQYCERGGERRVDRRIGRGECRGNGMDYEHTHSITAINIF